MRNLFILIFFCIPLLACSQNNGNLKDKYADYFLIGATINQEDYQIIDKDEKVLQIVSENFNSLTPENSMKWMHSHPEYSKFTFSNAQKITDFAKDNDMYLLGHICLSIFSTSHTSNPLNLPGTAVNWIYIFT